MMFYTEGHFRRRGRVYSQPSRDPENVGLNSRVGLLSAAAPLPFAVQPSPDPAGPRASGGPSPEHHVG